MGGIAKSRTLIPLAGDDTMDLEIKNAKLGDGKVGGCLDEIIVNHGTTTLVLNYSGSSLLLESGWQVVRL